MKQYYYDGEWHSKSKKDADKEITLPRFDNVPEGFGFDYQQFTSQIVNLFAWAATAKAMYKVQRVV